MTELYSAGSPPTRRSDRWIIGAVALAALVFYFGTALGPGSAWFARQPDGYYGFQTAGFRAGHLYAAIAPHPELLALKDPYDPVANAPYRVHDMTLYGGHYYLYFGVTPILILFWPVVALTGWYPTESFFVAAACTAAVWIGLGLLGAMRRRYFAAASPWAFALAAGCLVGANPMSRLVESPQFYQVPISCAICLHLAMLAAIYRCLHSDRHALRWLALASGLYGLAVGARPNHAASGLALGVAIVVLGCRAERALRWRRTGSALLAAAVPAAACAVGLLAYNWLRFDSPFEFGMRYQLAGETFLKLKPIQIQNIWPHLKYYLFGRGFWSVYFPFFSAPIGQPYGFMRYIPWSWLALLAWLPARFGAPEPARRNAFTLALLAAVLGNLLLLMSFFGNTDRYPGEFACSWLVLSGIGALALSQRCAVRRRARGADGVLGLLAASSVGAALAVYVAYAPPHVSLVALGRAANWPRYIWRKAHHEREGGLRLDVRLRADPGDMPEPLFETGRSGSERDWLQLDYLPGDQARVVFFHAGMAGLQGEPFPLPGDRRLIIEARCGALLPPFYDPVFSGWTRDEFATARRNLQVKVNGVERLRAVIDCYETSPSDLTIGHLAWPTGGVAQEFSGRVAAVERLDLEAKPPPLPRVELAKPVELLVRLPAQHEPGGDPILVTGQGSQSDLLYCFYDGHGRIRFMLDHYGNGGPASDWVTYDPTSLHRLTIWLGSMADADTPRTIPSPAAGPQPISWEYRLFVRFDGKVLLNAEQVFYPGIPGTTHVAVNPYVATTAGRRFEGQVEGFSQVGFAALPPLLADGTYGQVELTLKFPTNAYGTHEPLVVSGISGAGDLLYVDYIDSSHISIGLDHWGFRGLNGAPIEIDYADPHQLSLTMGSLHPPGSDPDLTTRVRVTIDGQTALEGQMRCHPSAPSMIRIGRNPIGGSTCGPTFTGQMLSVRRLAEATP
jgi:hypothetical protein